MAYRYTLIFFSGKIPVNYILCLLEQLTYVLGLNMVHVLFFRYRVLNLFIYIVGKRLEGIWHTGIVVYGQEYFFGGTGGIECCPPVIILLHF